MTKRMDRAGVVEEATFAEVSASGHLHASSALAVRELARDDSGETLAHLTEALRSFWTEMRAAELAARPFVTDAEATAALEAFGKDDAARDAWVKDRLDGFRKSVAPTPTIVDAVKAWPATALAKPEGSLAVDVTRSILGFGRHVVAPGEGYYYVRAVPQGLFRPRRLFIEPAGDVAVPCEKCGHENEGRKLSSLRVMQVLVGCVMSFTSAEGLPAHLFSVRHADAPPPDPTYPTASPGITVAIELKNCGCQPIEVEVAMFGDYAAGGGYGLIG